MTFSIIGYDPETEELGIAVQSKFLGVGAVVPWAKAGVGAVATQSYANPAYGPDGLALMEQGKTAEEALKTLVEADEGRSLRQARSEEHTSELQSRGHLVCRLLLEKIKRNVI